MKAILISGSPRKQGNTAALIQVCAEELSAAGIGAHVVSLAGKSIKGCTACLACRDLNNECSIKDDDFHPILANMLAADIVVVGSPVYYGSATPELMALLDRAGYCTEKGFSRKIGGPIVVARRAGQNFTYGQLLYWYMINDMIVPGSTYWNVSFGMRPGTVMEDEEGIRTVKRFAENLAWLAGKISG